VSTDPATHAANPDFVTSFARGLSIIRALSAHQRPMSLAEVASAAGLSRPAARRFLITLTLLGYAEGADGRWTLTPRVLELGYSYLSGLGLPEIARPHLERLAGDLDQSAAVAVLDELDIVYVARVASSRMMRVHIDIGTRLPAHSTSIGRVLLAALPEDELSALLERVDLTPRTPRSIRSVSGLRKELERVRRQGYALIDGELDPDIKGISVPLHGGDGTTVAALNCSVHVRGAMDVAIRDTILPRLQSTAADIEAELRILAPRPVVAEP